MRTFLPVEDLARDDRFVRYTMRERMADKRASARIDAKERGKTSNRITPDRRDAADAARGLMHGILVGEIQALEGAGRTCHDFRVTGIAERGPLATQPIADAAPAAEVPFALKLDMARQAWDEARHVEISVKLAEWMGSDIGSVAENTVLFEAACSTDPVLRLAGVNRALEGLAIDVFTTMKEFGELAQDPYLAFCEDWMLADEVTHVKMGSDWLRSLTANDPARRERALEFQRVVDKMFSFGGTRSDSMDSPIGLARRFRELAGFTDDEVADIAEVSLQALNERKQSIRAARRSSADAVPPTSNPPTSNPPTSNPR